MSLLTTVQDAMVICGFDSPSLVYASSDPTTTIFKTLSQVEGDALCRRFDWRALKVLGTLTGDGTSTDFTLPNDFDRFMTGDPMWIDESPELPLQMVNDDEMLRYKVAQTDPVNPVWRLFGDTIEFYPAPDNGDAIKLEYRSKYWVIDETLVTRRARWAADTDVSLLPERLISLGIVWRFKQAKGFDYAEDYRTYQIECAKAGASDNGRQTIRLRSNFFGDYADAPASDPRVV